MCTAHTRTHSINAPFTLSRPFVSLDARFVCVYCLRIVSLTRNYKTIFTPFVSSMRVILEAMDKMELPLHHEANRNYAIIIMSLPVQIEGEYMPHEVAVAVQNLWVDPNVQQAFQRSREYQLNDSAK